MFIAKALLSAEAGLEQSPHLIPTTIDSMPVNCSTYVSLKPTSRIHP
jgi:hypothetical protein